MYTIPVDLTLIAFVLLAPILCIPDSIFVVVPLSYACFSHSIFLHYDWKSCFLLVHVTRVHYGLDFCFCSSVHMLSDEKCACPVFTNKRLAQIFLSAGVKAGPINQPVVSWDAIKREGLQTCPDAFLFRDIMAYSEFVKGMAVGLMRRVWRNARRVSREPNKTIQR